MTRSLADSTWPELESDSVDRVLAVPVGATEQHGPHLPLSTDTDIAAALATLAAELLPELVVAPPLAYGASGEHQDFPGTISIGREATELLLVELCRSASATFARIVLVSTHGGNADPVRRAVARLRAEGRDVRAWSPDWDGDAHAGETETSVMLALDSARVGAEPAESGNVDPIEDLIAELVEVGVREVSASGVLGDPRGASAESGQSLIAAAANDLVRTVESWTAVVRSTEART